MPVNKLKRPAPGRVKPRATKKASARPQLRKPSASPSSAKRVLPSGNFPIATAGGLEAFTKLLKKNLPTNMAKVGIDLLKRSEKETRRARDYAESLLRSSPYPLLILDAKFYITSANEAFYQFFHLTPKNVVGEFIYELHGGAWDIRKLRHLLENIIPKNRFFSGFEINRKFGELGERKLALNARRVQNPTDNILLGIVDISELAQLTDQVRSSELRYRRLFEAAKDGILILDPETARIVDANPFMSEMLGYTHEELIGRELYQIGMLKDRQASLEAFDVLRKKNFIRYDFLPLKTKAGKSIEMELVGNRYPEDGRHVIQCNIRDISARRNNETALREAQALLADHAAQLEDVVNKRAAELSELNEQLNAFVYTIAHDLRAPLRAMEGFATMLLMEEGMLGTERAREYAKRISRAARFMDELLTDLLTFSRLNQEKIELNPVNLEKLVRAVMGRLEKEIQEKQASVEFAGPWPVVLAYEPILGQILFNLVNNGLKFVAPGIRPIIKVRVEDRGETLRLWVEDNGVGILPEYHEQIFRVFTRLEGDKFPGTGIGLAIVQKGMQRMGGQVGVESEPGEGSRFWLELKKA